MIAVQGFRVGGRGGNMTLPRQETQVHGILHSRLGVSLAAAGNGNADNFNLGMVEHKKNRWPVVNGHIGIDYPFLNRRFSGRGGLGSDCWRAARTYQAHNCQNCHNPSTADVIFGLFHGSPLGGVWSLSAILQQSRLHLFKIDAGDLVSRG